jgi:hypothetical protein
VAAVGCRRSSRAPWRSGSRRGTPQPRRGCRYMKDLAPPGGLVGRASPGPPGAARPSSLSGLPIIRTSVTRCRRRGPPAVRRSLRPVPRAPQLGRR